MYVCFIDLEKAFDMVKQDPLVEALRRFAADDQDIRVITKLYWELKAVLRVADKTSEWFNPFKPAGIYASNRFRAILQKKFA